MVFVLALLNDESGVDVAKPIKLIFEHWLMMSAFPPAVVLVACILLVLSTISLAIILLPSVYSDEDGSDKDSGRLQVLVLGDLGRSPRMQYHAISLAKNGWPVDLVGYLGTSRPRRYNVPLS